MPAGLTAGPAEKRLGFVLFVTTNVTAWPDSFAGPALIPVAQPLTVCAPASSATVWSAPFVKLGASLTPVTVMMNVCVGAVGGRRAVVAALSVIVAVPNAFAAGV